ncbi:gamma-glutamylcyclotransferase [Kushneria aurantia]|uniref:glutathione-specific gamma-glutamylcyclotransferase n=1 Tax=Kushneria aurantia TaxID=504092 RepID=A0ABV6FZM4_9GAMM|nr:gamma-glutamylcyclotransferase [Kushneria aurantia]
MSHHSRDATGQGAPLAERSSLWLFGYGSLIYKAGFDFQQRRPAHIRGWRRRFWQGSHDHRGTLSNPGRVATLVAEEGAVCHGMAYRIGPEVLAGLDIREKNGYRRFMTPLWFDDGDSRGTTSKDEGDDEALVYIATEGNEAWLGEASAPEIAAHISAAVGPSGPNRDYLLLLAQSLREMGHNDAHVFAVEEALLALEGRRHTTG